MKNNQNSVDLLVIGAGLVGLASAYCFLKKNPDSRVLVLEKEPDIAMHQSGRNSGVIHSGLYYPPGSFKSQFCLRGRQMLLDYAQAYGVTHEICGKVVVATKESDIAQLDTIYSRGLANGLSGIRKVDAQEIQSIEPYIRGLAGIQVPEAGIIDFRQLAQSLAEQVCMLSALGKQALRRNSRVEHIESRESLVKVYSGQQCFEARALVNCAGLFSDRIATMAGAKPEVRIVPFRGDYYELLPEYQERIRHLVYPVPDPNFPFLGVHFTRMCRGGVECGPNAVLNFDREGYSRWNFRYRDAVDSLIYSGTWRLLAKHWRYALGEYHRAFSRKAFVKALANLMPSIRRDMLAPARAGIRAQAMRPDGSLENDFVIQQHERCVHVLNAPSPAATSCLAIGEHVVEQIGKSAI